MLCLQVRLEGFVYGEGAVAEDLLDVADVERLFDQQFLSQTKIKVGVLFDVVFVKFDHGFGLFCALEDYFFDLAVDQGLHLFAVWLGVLGIREGNVTELVVHAELCD